MTCGDRNAFFQLENWHPLIADLTFGMTTMPLSLAESRVITAYKEISKMLLMNEDFEIQADKDPGVSLGAHWDNNRMKRVDDVVQQMLPAEQSRLLRQLVERLDAAIAGYGGAAFVKLSTRSPKDAVLLGDAVKVHLRRMIGASTLAAGTPEADEEDMVAFVRAISWAMRVTSGYEALTLLTRSTRAFQDLLLADLHNTGEHFPLALVVRPWVDIQPEFEFRAFVFGGRLTACSQYYPDCFVSSIAARRELIRHKIQSFWQDHVRHRIPDSVPDYTVDVVLSPDLERVTVVELNNPPPLAGVALYDWNDERDRQEIMHGGGEFQLRVLTAPKPDAKSFIHPPLAHLIYHLRGRHDETTSPALVFCDGCRANPDSGVWYFCRQCGDYELCEQCYPRRQELHPVHAVWVQASCPSWIASHSPPPSAWSCQLV